MFGIQFRQLQNKFITFIKSANCTIDSALKERILMDISGNGTPPHFQILNDHLKQNTILAQIFTRRLSQLAYEDPSSTVCYKILVLEIFAENLIKGLADIQIESSIFKYNQILFDKEKEKFIFEQLKTLKKEKNKGLTTIENILNYLMEIAANDYVNIIALKSWNDVLSYVFGFDSENEGGNVKEIEHVNLKELLLSYNVQGLVIQQVFDRYDAILAYTMSLLTMLAGSKFVETYAAPLNSILDSISSATRMILIQQRLKKTLETHIQFLKILEGITEIQEILHLFKDWEKINLDRQFPANVVDLPGVGEIINAPQQVSARVQLTPIWHNLYVNLQELDKIIKETQEYFDSIIRSANDITASLFSKGFQAAIPMQEVELCEKVGLHLKNITATSSTLKTVISDEYYDRKFKFLRQFETDWGNFQIILSKKCDEESSIRIEQSNLKQLNEILSNMKLIISDWNARAVFNGYGEEVVIASRVLASATQMIKKMHEILSGMTNTPLNSDNLPKFLPIYIELTEKFHEFEKLAQMVNIINDISKKIWVLKREFVLRIAEESQYFMNPPLICKLLTEMPQILKIEFQQRLIPAEVRNSKLDIYNQIIALASKLEEFSPKQREVLIPYERLK